VVANCGIAITVHPAARMLARRSSRASPPEPKHMKQRTFLSPAITALLLCGALATPLAFAQTHHKHHKKTTTSEQTQASTTTDTGTNAMSSDTTTTAGTTSTDSAAMSDQSTTAQTNSSTSTPATPATPYPGTGTAATPATPATPADAAAASMGNAPTTARQMSWSDLDTDHDGNLSKTEAGSLSSLSQVFDTADGNKDGSLTADEYRAYLKTQGK